MDKLEKAGSWKRVTGQRAGNFWRRAGKILHESNIYMNWKFEFSRKASWKF